MIVLCRRGLRDPFAGGLSVSPSGSIQILFEPLLAKFLFDVLTATAIDVISKRTVDSRVRQAAKFYRAFSLASAGCDAYGAWRIAAYTTVGGIFASEIIVERVTETASNALPKLDGINFEVSKKSEELLFSPDFTVNMAHNPDILQPYGMLMNQDFIRRELATSGGELTELVHPCLGPAIHANRTVHEILTYPECMRERRTGRWGRRENWIDHFNTSLGYALWRPIPEIGLGARTISNLTFYNGIFRRDVAEGYGRIRWTNGDEYYGQVRDGWERGYGVKRFVNGTLLIGYFNDMHRSLGVSLTPQRDRALCGGHRDGMLDGYGRQIGIRNGTESVTAFWQRGTIMKPLEVDVSKANDLSIISRITQFM
jgi:hypothetical protein